jgi:DNA ligase-1
MFGSIISDLDEQDGFPKLFKLTSKGQIQEWQIFVDGGKFYTVEGIQGGKATTSKPTVCKVKNPGKANATSPEQQALKEAAAKHKKKLEGQYFKTVAEASGGNKNWYEPMLAFKFEDYKEGLVYPVYSQPKLDGIRCIITAEGMFSRQGKPFPAVPHIFNALKPFFAKNKNAILDGELYCEKLSDNFPKLVSLIKKNKPTPEDLAESAQIIEFWCYDAPRIGVYAETDKFYDRFQLMSSLLLNRYAKIKVVSTFLISNYEQLTIRYEKYLEDGYEGQMVRLNGAYENKRSKNLLKRKEFVDEEYEIVSLEEGKGGRIGTVGFMNFYSRGGKPFKSNVKGEFDYLRKLWADRLKLVGKKATIKYFSLTPDRIPRFPYVIAIRDYE